MKRYSRMVQYFDMGLAGKTLCRDIPNTLRSPRTLDQLMNELESLRELNLARKKVSKKSKQEFRLEHMEERDDCWVLLINVVDTTAPHPVTQKVNGEAGDRKVIVLDDRTGLESSSHVVIFKAQNKAKKHLVLFEKSSALPHSKASGFICFLFRRAAKQFSKDYRVPHPSGQNGRHYNVFAVAHWYGHPSDDFKLELQEGVISDLRITSGMETVKGYESDTYPELIGTEIKMKTSRLDVILAGGNWNYLKKALTYAKTLDSEFVRVSFRDPTGANHTAVLSADTEQLFKADKYIKKRRIAGFSVALRTAFPIIQDGIVKKMLELEKYEIPA